MAFETRFPVALSSSSRMKSSDAQARAVSCRKRRAWRPVLRSIDATTGLPPHFGWRKEPKPIPTALSYSSFPPSIPGGDCARQFLPQLPSRRRSPHTRRPLSCCFPRVSLYSMIVLETPLPAFSRRSVHQSLSCSIFNLSVSRVSSYVVLCWGFPRRRGKPPPSNYRLSAWRSTRPEYFR